MDSIYNSVSVNLKIQSKNDLQFPFLDYGFLYGYGLFETLRVENSNPILLQNHIQRMRNASIILDIQLEYSDQEIVEHIYELINTNNISNAILNIYLTPGNRGDDPTRKVVNNPFFMVVLRQWPNYQPDERLILDIREQSFEKTRLDQFKTLAWIKNLLENKFAHGADDVILYDHNQYLLETSRSNIFLIKGNTLVTPDSPVILKGITRAFVLKYANQWGYVAEERKVLKDELLQADEIFLTNSLRGIVWVDSIHGKATVVSGKKTGDIQEKYCHQVKSYNKLSLKLSK